MSSDVTTLDPGRTACSRAPQDVVDGTRCAERLVHRSWRRDGLWLMAMVFAGMFALVGIRRWNTLDAHAYWAAWQHSFYSLPSGAPNAYLYSPAFAQLLWPFTHLPWSMFLALWMLGLSAVTAWLIAPLRYWAIPAFLACVPAIITGNVYPLFALVVVTGIRYPAAWALPLLTKVTPGVGLVWFAVRREWRNLVIALGATAGIIALSAMFMPEAWTQWVSFMGRQRHATHASSYSTSGLPAPSLVVRLPLAVAVVAVAAKTNRRWLLPVGMLLADPMFNWFALLSLTAIPRLRRQCPQQAADVVPVAADGVLVHA